MILKSHADISIVEVDSISSVPPHAYKQHFIMRGLGWLWVCQWQDWCRQQQDCQEPIRTFAEQGFHSFSPSNSCIMEYSCLNALDRILPRTMPARRPGWENDNYPGYRPVWLPPASPDPRVNAENAPARSGVWVRFWGSGYRSWAGSYPATVIKSLFGELFSEIGGQSNPFVRFWSKIERFLTIARFEITVCCSVKTSVRLCVYPKGRNDLLTLWPFDMLTLRRIEVPWP